MTLASDDEGVKIDSEALRTLKAKAEAATPGPWFHQEDEVMEDCAIADRIVGPYLGEQVCQVYVDSENEIANADFIAAFNPQVALALIERIEKLEKRNVGMDAIQSLLDTPPILIQDLWCEQPEMMQKLLDMLELELKRRAELDAQEETKP